MGPTNLRAAVSVFALLFLTYAYFFQSGEHNESARFDQLRSLSEEGSFAIDKFVYNTADIISFQGHYYPNKPPGATFLALPAWYVSRLIVAAFDVDDKLREHLWCYFTSLFSVGLSGALVGALLFCFLRRHGSSFAAALALAAAYGLGTLAFPFSTTFFSHQMSAALVFAAFYAAVEAIRRGFHRRLLLFAGAAAGFAVSVDYPSVLGLAIIGAMAAAAAWKVSRLPGADYRRIALAFASYGAGAALGVLPLLAYNLHVFGTPFFVTYSVYAQGSKAAAFPGHQLGFMGVRLPDFQTLFNITFGSERGLFVCNPWLAAIFPALFVRSLSSDFATRFARYAAFAICAAFLAFNAGYGDSIVYWGGGHSVGPRHLIPSLPFFAIAIAPLLERRLGAVFVGVLALPSVLIMLMAAAVEPRVPYGYRNPVVDFLFAHFQFGRFSLLKTGVFNDQAVTADSVAFNLGELAGLAPRLQLVPLTLLWLIFSLLAVLRLRRTGARVPAGVGLGLISIPLAATLFCALVPASGAATLELPQQTGAGLVGSYYDRMIWHPQQLPAADLPAVKPFFRTVDRAIDFLWPGGRWPFRAPHAMEWRGRLLVPASGRYRFELGADDGAALWIEGKPAAVNWGVHRYTEVVGEVELRQGEVEILLRYFNFQYGGRLRLRWQAITNAMPREQELRVLAEPSIRY